MNNPTKWGRAMLALAAAAAAFLVFASGGPAAAGPPVAPATLLTSGGENTPPPDTTPPPDKSATPTDTPTGAGSRDGAGQPGTDKAALTGALLVLIKALGLTAEDLLGCATAAGSTARAGSAGGCDTGAVTQNTSTITISKHAFGATLTVAPGSRVTVVNKDKVAHNLTSSSPGGFGTGDLTQGASATFTAPTTAGRYRFVCTIHPDMVGTLVVADAAGSGSGTSAPASSGARATSTPPVSSGARGSSVPSPAVPPGGRTNDTVPTY